MAVAEIRLYRLSLPLMAPYRVPSKEILQFDLLVAEILDEDGRAGWGEALISRAMATRRPGRAGPSATRGRRLCASMPDRGFAREEGCRFAAAPDPTGIELFEQPCAMEDWAANAAVAAVSRVPVMLDESICGMADIERAATIPGVGFVKLKLKKLGSLARLEEGLQRISAFGMTPVLGDRVATGISCWMEGCVARGTITNAGEMNGYRKPRAGLFAEPLPLEDGAMVLRPGSMPAIDRESLAAHVVEECRHAATPVPAG